MFDENTKSFKRAIFGLDFYGLNRINSKQVKILVKYSYPALQPDELKM